MKNPSIPRWRRVRTLPAWSALALILGASGAARAHQVMDSGSGLLVAADAAIGGDSVDTLYYSNGLRRDIPTGNGITLSVGAHVRLGDSPVELVGTVGYKFLLAAASNGNPTFTRTTVTLRADYHLDEAFWVGLGPVLHSRIQYDSDGFGFDQTFQDARGLTVVAGWHYLALTYTQIRYKNQYQQSFGANSLAAGVVWRF